MKKFIVSLFLFTLIAESSANDKLPVILSMRERAELRDRWLDARLEKVIPQIMRREGIDMWVIIAREYNEDPVFKSMAPSTWISARRRTILVFFDNGEGKPTDRLAVARYDIGRFFKSVWNKEKQPDQWKRLAELIQERNPQKVAINYSKTFALGDGVTHSEFESFKAALPESYHSKIVSGERLAIGWLETRIPEEMAVYSTICKIAHDIIAEGFSPQVIQPGFTTTADVQWWYRERIRELKLVTWFHPSVSIQRADDAEHSGNFSSKPGEQIIQRGDLLHVDFGINYLGLNTDTQQHAYVLKFGETEAPQGLRDALKVGNRLQDILMMNFKQGRSGNEILAASLKQAKSESIVPSIYTHPIGFHGHAAGPTIGLWDQQGGVPGRGDYELFYNTAHSIELNATVEIPEWNNKKVRIMLEEDAIFDESGCRFIDPRQTELILIL